MNSKAATAEAASPSPVSSVSYRRYVLFMLMVVYAINMVDRQIVTILAEPIKTELRLADWQLGALTGLSFALFYTFLGIPVARLADRANRVAIISASLAIWSAFTVACGFARSFPQLLLFRIGVAVGEAGCSPPSHSLISEYAPKEKRASALAFYSLGIPLGSLLGMAFGGVLAHLVGWRMAFVIAGVPGILLAVAVYLTIREPRRAAAKLAQAAPAGVSFREAMRELRAKKSFWWMSLAAGFLSFVFYGHSAFYGSLFLRAHGADLERLGALTGLGALGVIGVALGLVFGLGSGSGTILGGILADKAARKDISGYTRISMMAALASAPLFALAVLVKSGFLALALIAPSVLLLALCYGPTFAAVQSIVRPEVRATAAAVLLFLTNLIGLGLGPLLIGGLSDLLGARFGQPGGLQAAMAISAAMMVVAAGCFALAHRTIREEECS